MKLMLEQSSLSMDKRARFTPEQRYILEVSFKQNKYPTYVERESLADNFQATEYQVRTWFKNRRSKEARTKTVGIHAKRKPRCHFNSDQLWILNAAFKENPLLNAACRKELAETTNCSENSIKAWFQNRRAKYRRSMAVDDVRTIYDRKGQLAERRNSLDSTTLDNNPSPSLEDTINEQKYNLLHQSMDERAASSLDFLSSTAPLIDTFYDCSSGSESSYSRNTQFSMNSSFLPYYHRFLPQDNQSMSNLHEASIDGSGTSIASTPNIDVSNFFLLDKNYYQYCSNINWL